MPKYIAKYRIVNKLDDFPLGDIESWFDVHRVRAPDYESAQKLVEAELSELKDKYQNVRLVSLEEVIGNM